MEDSYTDDVLSGFLINFFTRHTPRNRRLHSVNTFLFHSKTGPPAADWYESIDNVGFTILYITKMYTERCIQRET